MRAPSKAHGFLRWNISLQDNFISIQHTCERVFANPGMDSSHRYSLVIKLDSMRTTFATTMDSYVHTKQFGICTAHFINSLDEIIFMVQPERFIDNKHPEFVCLLLWCLYKQEHGTCHWNRKFDTFSEKYDLIPSAVDPCHNMSKSDDLMFLSIFVDDGLIYFGNPS